MQNNILFTFALILSIFYCAQAQQKRCSYCSDQAYSRKNPKIDQNTDFGLGVDPNYIFDRYTVPELQNDRIFPYNDIVIDKPKGVCVYENKEGIKNTNLRQGAWYPLTDRFLKIDPTNYVCPNTDPKKSICLITDGTAPLFKWYKTYPGKLYFYYMGSANSLVHPYKKNGILGIMASKDQPYFKYIEQDKAYTGADMWDGVWYKKKL